MKNDQHVVECFERQFNTGEFQKYIESCKYDELEGLFVRQFRESQPVLEAGCGSGRWMHHLKKKGITCVGIDWSEKLQVRSKRYDKEVQFDVGDLRQLPYESRKFKGIFSLGAIEHVIEGPHQILREFYRVLDNGGYAIITVPYFSVIRRISRSARDKIFLFKMNNVVRRLFRKPRKVIENNRDAIFSQRYREDIRLDATLMNGRYEFFQYQFTLKQFKEEIEKTSLKLLQIFPTAKKYGIYENFGNIAGKFDAGKGIVELSRIGRFLFLLIPARACGHMLCAILKK